MYYDEELKMKKAIVLFVMSLVMISSGFISAQSFDRTPWCFWNNYSSRLNLSSAQKLKMENLYQNFLKAIYPTQNQLTSKAYELRILLFKSVSNKTTIITKQKELFALQQKIQEKIFDYRLNALDVLTTEQILLLPSDCCLGINMGRGYGRGIGRGNNFAYGFGYTKSFSRGFGRGRGMGWRNGRGRRGMRYRSGFCPYWQR